MRKIFDLAIDSSLDLPDLPSSQSDGANITIDIGSAAPASDDNIHQWLHRTQRADGSFGYGWFKRNESYIFRFSEIGEFCVTPTRGLVTVSTTDSGTSHFALRHALIDQVLPLLVAQMGNLVLHASTVAWGDLSAVFIGSSGAGKSALGMALAQTGRRLLGDDAVLLRRRHGAIRCITSYRGARLRRDSAAQMRPLEFTPHFEPTIGKYRFCPLPAKSENLNYRLAAIFLLETKRNQTGTRPHLEALGPIDLFRTLAMNAFSVDLTSATYLSRHCQRISDVLDCKPVAYRLVYDHSYDELQTVVDAVDRLMSQVVGDSCEPCIKQ